MTLTICALLPSQVQAESFSWMSGKIDVTTTDVTVQNSDHNCQEHLVRIGSRASNDLVKVCVYERPSWRYGYYTEKSGPPYAPSYSTKFVVAIGNDSAMYELSGIPSTGIVHSPDYDGLVFDQPIIAGISESRHVSVVKNLPNSVERSYNALDKTIRYAIKDGAITGLIKDVSGNTVTTNAINSSTSGAKLAIEIKSLGLAVYDLHTEEIHVFSDFRSRPWPFVTHLTFTLSADGQHVAVKIGGSYLQVYSRLSSCAVSAGEYSDDLIQRVEDSDLCANDGGRLQTALSEKLGTNRAERIYNLEFNDEGSVIKGYTSSLNPNIDPVDMDDYVVTEVTMLANGHVDQQKLDYLALGDSYSSGEGDAETRGRGESYYTSATAANGGCHISTRSYPYILRNIWAIPEDKMSSIACSGALVLPDYISPADSYKGQLRWLQESPESIRKSKQKAALGDLSPGHIPQMEFVEKYKPRIITLTAGGNDVGFASILKYCASPTWQGLFTFADDTCSYAKSGSQLHKLLYSSIDSQYSYTKMLLDRLQSASPNTEIILVGYPSFISSSNSCSANSASLDLDERNMINAAVTYMNSALSKAAAEKNVSFINLETVLEGGRLCEGSEYVTGYFNLGLADIIDQEHVEMFHPNASGHHRVAERIHAWHRLHSTPAVDQVPSESQYEPSTDYVQTIRRTMTSSSKLLARSAGSITLQPHSLRPNSQAKLTGYSESIQLGTFRVDEDGSLSGIIPADSLPIGNHVLLLEGETYSGEPVRYTQFIDVLAYEDDADGDGIPNEKDKCNFIKAWIDEKTGKDTCTQPKIAISSDSTLRADRILLSNNFKNTSTIHENESLKVDDAPEASKVQENNNGHVQSKVPEEPRIAVADAQHEDEYPNNMVGYLIVGSVLSLVLTGGIYVIHKRAE